jgi:hypothetical protein
MSFFLKNNCINHVSSTKKTNNILKNLYNDILNAYNYLLKFKNTNQSSLYPIKIKHIDNIFEIPKPSNFNANSFPNEIRTQIDEHATTELSYEFSLFDRNIILYFILEEPESRIKISEFIKYIDLIIMWLYILNDYGSKSCSNTLTIYFYFTKLEKELPTSNIFTIDQINVNTAFTTTCPKNSEIVVFRKEEWFKVFMHETFHNFALDFSGMNNEIIHKQILSLFPVNSEVNLYESYTEFWGEIMNALFCSFSSLEDKSNINEFLQNCEFFINFERTYSFFQLVKTLNFMGLNYSELYNNDSRSELARKTFYKEKTNVLSYYIIKTILMNNYQHFLLWCHKNNLSILSFKKTEKNQEDYVKFIMKNYKTTSMLEGIKRTEFCIDQIKKNESNINKNVNKFISKNMRMSICELG